MKRGKKSSPADNEAFIYLIQAAREDAGLRARLLAIVDLEGFHRRSFLNGWIEEMRLKGAPPDIIKAAACLLDDDIARRAAEVLRAAD